MESTSLAGLAVAAAVLAVAAGFGLWLRRRDGTPRPVPAGQTDPTGELLAAVGVETGDHATLLQFSSAFCAPCRATRVTCARLAAATDRVRHIEVDAESQLPVVRALGVWRTPTVFVVDGAGRLTARVTGAPTRAQLAQALAPIVPEVVP